MVRLKPVLRSKPQEKYCWKRVFMGVSLAGLVLVAFTSKLPRHLQPNSSSAKSIKSVVKASMMTSTSNPSASSLSSHHRILCYGDSLTAGSSGLSQHPYAPHLEAKLTNVDVKWIGLPGWTADNMLQNRDNANIGLRATLQRYRDQESAKEYLRYPVSLVILLAGTNDLGYGFDTEEIFDNLYRMHETCFENHVPHTIAIGIPPSAYQSMEPAAAELARSVNERLRSYCSTHSDKAKFVDFPFAYERGGTNWDPDGLHRSAQGYRVLGEFLAPTVAHILKSLEDASS